LIDKHPLGFKLELHHKDLAIAIDLAKSINIDLPIASKVKEIEQRLMQAGLGELDISVLHRYISGAKKEG
jgi:3-hydroxyisobutyrate dehydrogenase